MVGADPGWYMFIDKYNRATCIFVCERKTSHFETKVEPGAGVAAVD